MNLGVINGIGESLTKTPIIINTYRVYRFPPRQLLAPLAVGKIQDSIICTRYKPCMPYLTLIEAAEVARCAPTTLRRWIRKGRLRMFKPGRHQLIHEDELYRFLGEAGCRAMAASSPHDVPARRSTISSVQARHSRSQRSEPKHNRDLGRRVVPIQRVIENFLPCNECDDAPLQAEGADETS